MNVQSVFFFFSFAHGLFRACETMIPMKTTKHMNVLYLSITSCSCRNESSHFLFRNRSRIVEILLLNDVRSYSASSSSLLSRRRLEIMLLKLKAEGRDGVRETTTNDFSKLNIIYRTAIVCSVNASGRAKITEIPSS